MQVIKDDRIQQDSWNWLEKVESDQEIPEGDVILPFQYWKQNQSALANRNGNTAICLNGDDRVEDLAGYLDQFDLIALEFPLFKDGRCYSHARLLRDRYHFKGDLRAVGDVLRDQVFFLKRCGISSFNIRKDKDIKDALNALKDFSVTYQTAADGNPPIYKKR